MVQTKFGFWLNENLLMGIKTVVRVELSSTSSTSTPSRSTTNYSCLPLFNPFLPGKHIRLTFRAKNTLFAF